MGGTFGGRFVSFRGGTYTLSMTSALPLSSGQGALGSSSSAPPAIAGGTNGSIELGAGGISGGAPAGGGSMFR
eukprot:10573287-Alexandrium_andersonii.AAC.1